MEQSGSKTIMCSVLFMDIIEYSKKSVAGQISLKDRFNRYLSSAIADVPLSDRIILDTGDGAAINFMGDVEDALKAAINLRAGILSEEPVQDPPLLVRMGINLGPVRLVRDLNGQPNIVGDGINVAQRVMGFAKSGQILVSRSYYDGAARLSPEYAGMFDYQGSRTDKHVRAHEVYAIGYPGENTTESMAADAMADQESRTQQLPNMVKTGWNSAASKLDHLTEQGIQHFRQASKQQRMVYMGIAAIFFMGMAILLALKPAQHGDAVIASANQLAAAATPVPVADSNAQNADASQQPAKVEQKNTSPGVKAASTETQPKVGLANTGIQPKKKTGEEASLPELGRPSLDAQVADSQPKQNLRTSQNRVVISDNRRAQDKKLAAAPAGSEQPSYISINCAEGTDVFVDNVAKGKIAAWPLNLKVSAGKHMIRVSHPKWGNAEKIVVTDADKTLQLKSDFCQK